MEGKDINAPQNFSFEDLERNFYQKAPKILGEHWSEEFASLLTCSLKSDSSIERKRMQEHHNVGHALTFISFALISVTKGTLETHARQRALKTLGHLLCLREFILDEEVERKLIVHELFELFRHEFPDTREKWIKFLFKHWQAIKKFARLYNHSGYFPPNSYVKLRQCMTSLASDGESS